MTIAFNFRWRAWAGIALHMSWLIAVLFTGGCREHSEVPGAPESGELTHRASLPIGESVCTVTTEMDKSVFLPAVASMGTDGDALNYDEARIGRFLPDGGVVIASRRFPRLSFFGEDGQLVSRAGRSGFGPGELISIDRLRVTSDGNVQVLDLRATMEVTFTGAGDFISQLRFPFAYARGAAPMAHLSDGSWLVAESQGAGSMRMGEQGIRQDTVTVTRYSTDGQRIGVLASYPADLWFGDMTRFADTNEAFRVSVPFTGGVGTRIIGDSVLLISDGRHPRLLTINLSTGDEVQIPTPNGSRRVTEVDIENFRELYLADADLYHRQWYGSILEELPYPEYTPAYDGPATLLDPVTSLIWILEASDGAGESRLLRYTAIDAQGRARRRMDLSGFARALDVRGDRMLAVKVSEFDEESAWILEVACD